jgi:hypothetical protein
LPATRERIGRDANGASSPAQKSGSPAVGTSEFLLSECSRTNKFRPLVQGAPISHGRRPSHRKDAVILDGDVDLQAFAFVVGIGNRLIVGICELKMLFCIPCYCFRRGFIIEQLIPFDHMKGLSEWPLGEMSLAGEGYPTPRNQCWPEQVPCVVINFGIQIL